MDTALAAGTHPFLCFCCMGSANCYRTAFYTELCRLWELLEELQTAAASGLESVIWVTRCAASVLTPSFAFGTKTSNFISCTCMRYPGSLSIPCSFPLQILDLMLLTEPACSQTGGSPLQASVFLCCFPLHWAGNCQQSQGRRAEASASSTHLSHCPALSCR